MDIPSALQDKLRKYQAYWTNAPMDRPLIGFSLGGWFPFQSYQAMGKFRGRNAVEAAEFHPEDFLDDYDRIVSQWKEVEDDVIRAVAPLPFFPWLEAMLGCRVHIGNESLWAEEGGFAYANMEKIDFSRDNPWRQKYLEFAAILKDHYSNRYPVGQPILRGVSDMISALRSPTQLLYDLYDHPELFQRLATRCTDLFIGLVEDQQKVTGDFAGGYVVEQLALWAPDRIVRMQEDGVAYFSPKLYSSYLRDEEERQAAAFPYSVIHLHSTALFVLDRILGIEPLKCIQINKDAVGDLDFEKMLPYFQMVQSMGKKLQIRGKISCDDMNLLRKELSTRGLYIQIVVENPAEAGLYREFFQPWVEPFSIS